ncbi:hypothetical protein N431DRAFT_456189 [Stipitochalara longipes BDJ]|nr:hypothetical protein N431DRAFT_456189 [Stipitochalara longipes BDJ]
MFRFEIRAPASLCTAPVIPQANIDPHSDKNVFTASTMSIIDESGAWELRRPANRQDPKQSAISSFVKSITGLHHNSIFLHHPWRCIICDESATTLVESTEQLLSPTDWRAIGEPCIFNLVTPVCCGIGDPCNIAAREKVEEWKINSTGTSSSNSKRCSTNFVVYSSKECQKKDWPLHQKNCKPPQQEKKDARKAR